MFFEFQPCTMDAISQRDDEYPPKHWSAAEKAEYLAKLDAAKRALRLDWYDTSIGQSFETCGSASLGVILAGSIFPMVMSLVSIATMVLYDVPLSTMVTVFVAGFAFTVFGATAAILAQVVSMCAISLLNWTLGFVINARHQVVMTGGMAGFVCFGWVIGIPADEYHPDEGIYLFGIAMLVVFAAMLHGHVGALWSGGQGDVWYESLRAKQTEKSSRPNQLGIANLLLITLWCAIVFAIDRVTKFQATRVVIGYAVLQAILIGVDAVWLRFCIVKNRELVANQKEHFPERARSNRD